MVTDARDEGLLPRHKIYSKYYVLGHQIQILLVCVTILVDTRKSIRIRPCTCVCVYVCVLVQSSLGKVLPTGAWAGRGPGPREPDTDVGREMTRACAGAVTGERMSRRAGLCPFLVGGGLVAHPLFW